MLLLRQAASPSLFLFVILIFYLNEFSESFYSTWLSALWRFCVVWLWQIKRERRQTQKSSHYSKSVLDERNRIENSHWNFPVLSFSKRAGTLKNKHFSSGSPADNGAEHLERWSAGRNGCFWCAFEGEAETEKERLYGENEIKSCSLEMQHGLSEVNSRDTLVLESPVCGITANTDPAIPEIPQCWPQRGWCW